MQAILIASTLAVGWASGSSIDGSGDVAPSVTEILAVWSKRADSVTCGKIRWTIPAGGWNLFGRFDTEWVPVSDLAGREIGGTIHFDEQRVRYDSVTFSSADVAAPSTGLPISGRFSACIGAGFQDPKDAYRDLLAYTVIYSPARRVHFWHGDSNEYPVALILPAGPSMNLMSVPNFTGFGTNGVDNSADDSSAYLRQLLGAPALLTFRPLLFDSGFSHADACQIDDGLQPVYEGRVCSVLRVTEATKTSQSSHSSIPTERTYWVDPSRDFVVVRCMFKWDNAVQWQIDIQYEQMDKIGWLPSRWSVLRFGDSPNIVQQVATAVLENIDVQHPAVDGQIDLRFPPRTWVTDRVALRQYLVRDDFSEYEIEGDYRFPVYTHAELVAQSQGRAPVRATGIRRVLVGLTRWPGVLIPVTLMTGILIVTNSLLGRRRNARRWPATAENRPDPQSCGEEIKE